MRMALLFLLVAGVALGQDIKKRLDETVRLLSSSRWEERAKGRALLEKMWEETPCLSLLRSVWEMLKSRKNLPLDAKIILNTFLSRRTAELAESLYGADKEWLSRRPHLGRILFGLEEPDEEVIRGETAPAKDRYDREALRVLAVRFPQFLPFWQALRRIYENAPDAHFINRLPDLINSLPVEVLSEMRLRLLCSSPTCWRWLLARAEKEENLSILRHIISQIEDHQQPILPLNIKRRFYPLLIKLARKCSPDSKEFKLALKGLESVPRRMLVEAIEVLLRHLKKVKPSSEAACRIDRTLLSLLKRFGGIPKGLGNQVLQRAQQIAAQQGLSDILAEYSLFFEGKTCHTLIREALRVPFKTKEFFHGGLLLLEKRLNEMPTDLLVDTLLAWLREAPLIYRKIESYDGTVSRALRRLRRTATREVSIEAEKAVMKLIRKKLGRWSILCLTRLLKQNAFSPAGREEVFHILQKEMRGKDKYKTASLLLSVPDIPPYLRKKAFSILGHRFPAVVETESVREYYDWLAEQSRYKPNSFNAFDMVFMSQSTVNRLLLGYIMDNRNNRNRFPEWNVPVVGSGELWREVVTVGLPSLRRDDEDFKQTCALLFDRTEGLGWERFFKELFSMVAEMDKKEAYNENFIDSVGELMKKPFRYRDSVFGVAWKAYIDCMPRTPGRMYISTGAAIFIGSPYECCFAELLSWLIEKGKPYREVVLSVFAGGEFGSFSPSPSVTRLLAGLRDVGRERGYSLIAARAHQSCAPKGCIPLAVTLNLPPNAVTVFHYPESYVAYFVVSQRLFFGPIKIPPCPRSLFLKWFLSHLKGRLTVGVLQELFFLLSALLYEQVDKDILVLPEEVVRVSVEVLRRVVDQLKKETDYRNKTGLIKVVLNIAGALGPDLPSELAESLLPLISLTDRSSESLFYRNLFIMMRAKKISRNTAIKILALGGDHAAALLVHKGVPKEIKKLILTHIFYDPPFSWWGTYECDVVLEKLMKIVDDGGRNAEVVFCVLSGQLGRLPEGSSLPLFKFLLATLRRRNNPLLEEIFFKDFWRSCDSGWGFKAIPLVADWISGLSDERIDDFLTCIYASRLRNSSLQQTLLLLVLCREGLMRGGDLAKRALSLLASPPVNFSFLAEESKGGETILKKGVPEWGVRLIEEVMALTASLIHNTDDPVKPFTALLRFRNVSVVGDALIPYLIRILLRRDKKMVKGMLAALKKNGLPPLPSSVASSLAEECEGLLSEGDDETAIHLLGRLIGMMSYSGAKHAFKVLMNAAAASSDPTRTHRAVLSLLHAFINIKEEKIFNWAAEHIPPVISANAHLLSGLDPSTLRLKTPFSSRAAVLLFNATRPSILSDYLRTTLFYIILRDAPTVMTEEMKRSALSFLLRGRFNAYESVWERITVEEFASLAPYLPKDRREALFLLALSRFPEKEHLKLFVVLHANDMIPPWYKEAIRRLR